LDYGSRLVLAQVRADADCVDPYEFSGPGNHLAKTFEGAIGGTLQVIRIEAESQHSARLPECLQHVVRLVTGHRMPGSRVRMGNGNGPLGNLNRLDRRPVTRMRHVDYHAKAVHLADDLAPHAGDAGIVALVASGREKTL